MTESRSKSLRAVLKLILLLFILVVLPLGSWFYLQSGMKFRKERMEELGNLGSLSKDKLIRHDQREMDSAGVLLQNVIVLTASSTAQSIFEFQKDLIRQFDDRDDFGMLVTGIEDGRTDREYRNIDHGKASYWILEGDPLRRDGASWLHLDTVLHVLPDEYALLIDTSGTIRRVYDLSRPGDRTRLIEHIAMILPMEEKRRSD